MKSLARIGWRNTCDLAFPFFSELILILILSRADQRAIRRLMPIRKDINQTESFGSGGTATDLKNLVNSHFT
jgi:hypothetical protein